MDQLIVVIILLISSGCINSYNHVFFNNKNIKSNSNLDLKSKYLSSRINSRLYDTIKGYFPDLLLNYCIHNYHHNYQY